AHDHVERRRLLGRIARELPDLRFKIYARADTLMKFGDLDLLRDAGLVSVFVGVESLHQPDLDALNKKLRAETTIAALRRLHDAGIFTDLSFILFNSNTTAESLRVNLSRLADLWAGSQRRLGMPFFSFSFESTW